MEKGFTLIEIIIAVFILSIAIVGVYSAFSIIVILTTSSSDRLTATYLSQEGMEIIRNIRDTNWLTCDDPTICSFSSYLADVDTDCSTTGCEADFTTSPSPDNASRLTQWPSTSDGNYLNIDVGGFYKYSIDGTPSKFKRKLTITLLNDDHAMKVISEVIWNEKPNILNSNPTQPSVKTEEILYDWY